MYVIITNFYDFTEFFWVEINYSNLQFHTCEVQRDCFNLCKLQSNGLNELSTIRKSTNLF